ncbi:Sodium- and chloride-dependent glycine transporter 2 [Mizuhopecten yessoensis]|uniref:Transporter n=1 Tax=Mizuhopecten yessoensis TaxID=6573 RepID=A0A210R3K3_MIZYE|nr:Sodium- and chloride-dependent glycine transporter 2 [Mizuhopecten yessoensis]
MTSPPVDERGAWGNQVEFFLSCVGYAVGLGNIWRFPYLCFRNGGGAFLIPYVLMLALVGLPVFFLELAFGQFASLGPISIWRVNPLFKGIGYASVCVSTMVAIYYNVVIAYALYYLMVSLVSFDNNVPWATCGNSWNSDYCINNLTLIEDSMNATQKLNIQLGRMNVSCVENTITNYGLPYENLTYNFVKKNLTECSYESLYKTSSEEYFTNFVLRLNEVDNIGGIGEISPKLTVTLLIAWIFIFFSLMKGVKSSGKVIYFTATFPYLVLVILLVRGLTLEGYKKGIEFYIIPKWEQLANPRPWIDAASQIFYSLGPAFGSLITMSSYNKFKNNCYRDAILVATINCGTSVFAGFVIFSVLGFMAHITGRDVQDVATSGPGLVFIAYPEGIARMPFPPIWAFLFFFMLLLLGMSSQFGMVEGVISALSDEFPGVLRRYKTYWVFFVCMTLFLLGLTNVTQGGIWVLTLMNDYSGSYGILFIAFCELVALMWSYGLTNFCDDVEMMLGFRPNIFWKATWTVISPLIVLAIMVASVVKFVPSAYGDYVFEDWAQGVGWVLVAIPVLCIIVVAIIQLVRYGGFKAATTPLDSWGPAEEENRTGRYSSAFKRANRDFHVADNNGYVSEEHLPEEKNGHPPVEMTEITMDEKISETFIIHPHLDLKCWYWRSNDIADVPNLT